MHTHGYAHISRGRFCLHGIMSLLKYKYISRHIYIRFALTRVPMLAHLAYASYVGFSAEMSTNAATWCRGYQGVCWSAFALNYLSTVI